MGISYAVVSMIGSRTADLPTSSRTISCGVNIMHGKKAIQSDMISRGGKAKHLAKPNTHRIVLSLDAAAPTICICHPYYHGRGVTTQAWLESTDTDSMLYVNPPSPKTNSLVDAHPPDV